VGPVTVDQLRGRRRLRQGLAIFVGVLVASASKAGAQVIPTREIMMPPLSTFHVFEPWPFPLLSDPDTRDEVAPEDTPVKNRVQPEYATRGIRSGAWMFNPFVSAGALYDSNVFSSSTGQQSDVAAQIGAGLRAHSLWERHGIDTQLSTLSTLYPNHSGLNQTDANLITRGHYDIDHSTQLWGAFRAAYLHVGVGTLSSPAGAVEPTPYSLVSGNLTLRKELGRVTTVLGVQLDDYNFGSTRAQDGSIINQDSRSGPIYSAYGRVGYAFSEKSAFFTSVEVNRRDLQGTPAESLQSSGYRALAGVDIELTHLIKGEIAGGYMKQHFMASSIGNIEGPAYRAMLTWSPSRLVDVHFNAEQIVTEASDTSSTGILANAVQAGVDYEFRPNVILSAAATFEKDHFKGEPREDNVYALDNQIKYLLNNVTSLSFQYRYTRRDSNFPGFSYDKHQVGINAAAQF
jgi:hypothetical protein